MITRQKVLLVTKAPSVAKFVARFEAVKAISDVSQIFEVWENNKTPLILGTAVADCPIIYLPENGFADDKAFIDIALLEYLKTWLVDHIQQMDVGFASYVTGTKNTPKQ